MFFSRTGLFDCCRIHSRKSMIQSCCSEVKKVIKTLLRILILLCASVIVGYDATHNLHTSAWDTWHPSFPDHTVFYFHVSIVNHFGNKIVSAQRNVHIILILRRVPPKKGFLEFFFCLWIENVMHEPDPFSYRSSHGVGRLISHHILGIAGHIWPNRFCT